MAHFSTVREEETPEQSHFTGDGACGGGGGSSSSCYQETEASSSRDNNHRGLNLSSSSLTADEDPKHNL
jgi:hypothetical protein